MHHGNTRKVAKVMTGVLSADLLDPLNEDIGDVEEYDLIGFGSGIYAWKHHIKLLSVVDNLSCTNRKAFIFSTRGNLIRIIPIKHYHNRLRCKLHETGFDIMGEFSCLGFDTSGPLRFVGGKNRDHPDTKDLDDARRFAAGLRNESKFTDIMGS